MTRKYLDVRREIYEKNPSNIVNSYRSFSDMKNLFKWPFWTLLAIFIIALVSFIVNAIFVHNETWELIIMILIIIVPLLLGIPRERFFYHEPARANELSDVKQNYNQYVSEVWDILNSQGIDTFDKVLCLKNECNLILQKHQNTFEKINTKFIDMFIGVPIGALIASAIYSDSKAIPIAIWLIVITGIIFIGILKFISFINYYSEGHFKDKYLLDVLNELDYSDKVLEQSNHQ